MSRRTEKNVGIVGLGIIGQRVAARLRIRGFHVFVWNRTPRPFPNFVGSPAEIAQLCDFVQIFVSDDEALLEMVQQMKPALNAHHVIMAHCTVAPHTMRAAAEIVQRRGAQFIDAPFTGSKMAAEKGELVYYIGGDEAAYRRVRPVLEASSKEIVEIGEVGQATVIKVATNMITAATVQVAAEALALVHAAGLPLEKFATAMRSNGSNSGTMTMKLPMMIEGNFEPHFSVKHMLKDVSIAMRLAGSYELRLPATDAARDSLIREARNDRGDCDYSAVIHSFFPDGPPRTQRPPIEEPEAQATFALEEESPAERSPEAEPTAEEPEVFALDVVEEDELQGKIDLTPETEHEEVELELSEEAHESAVEADASEKEEPEEVPAEPLEEQSVVVAEPPTVATAKNNRKPEPDDDEERRGFFSRLFGRGPDY